MLVTELSRWGRSTLDLLHTLQDLEARRVSVIAMSGLAFDLSTPHGRMMATVLAGIAEFERELIQERIRSGMAAAKARGKRLGRQPGQRPKSDRLAPKVLALVAQGRSYRLKDPVPDARPGTTVSGHPSVPSAVVSFPAMRLPVRPDPASRVRTPATSAILGRDGAGRTAVALARMCRDR